MENLLKIAGISFVCSLALIVLLFVLYVKKQRTDRQKQWVSEQYYLSFQSSSELEKKYSGRGEYDVAMTDFSAANSSAGYYRIWYPAELTETNRSYPLVVVVNPGNMASVNYEAFFERLASWGFVVAGNDDKSAGDGVSAAQTLNFVLARNEDSFSFFYGKIDADSIGIVGYLQGGAGAIRAVTEYENSDAYKTIFTGSAAYPLFAKKMGWGYDAAKIKIPCFMTASTGASDDTGSDDIENEEEFAGMCPPASLVYNYDRISGTQKLRARAAGAELEDILARTDGYLTAWLLYRLGADAEAEKAFAGENAEILGNANWQDIEKNF